MIVPSLRVLERCDTVAITDSLSSARHYQSPCRRHVPLPTVAEDDRLDERRPAEIVDVIERRTSFDQSLHNRVMSKVGGRNQGSSIVSAGDRSGVTTEFDS